MANDNVITALLERQAVTDVITRLFVATDRRGLEGGRVLSLRGGALRHGLDGQRTRPESIGAFDRRWPGSGSAPDPTRSPPGRELSLQIAGDRATAFCYGVAFHHLPNPSGRNTRLFVGSYNFELEKRDDVWRITAFRFDLKFLEGNPRLETS